MLSYVHADQWHLQHLYESLREDDLVEVVLATGKLPREALTSRVLYAPGAAAYAIRGTMLDSTLAVFGALPIEGQEEGAAWFLATTEIEAHSRELMKTITPCIDALSEPYTALTALMWSNNRMHLRWAKAMGFEHRPELDTIIRGNKFLYIYRPTR